MNVADDNELNHIIDVCMLEFLDDFEDEFGRLPSQIEKSLWMRGFIDACKSIQEATESVLDD
jgi:hypothetical protein